MRRLVSTLCLLLPLLLLAACNSGDSPGTDDPAPFQTADSRGIGSMMDPATDDVASSPTSADRQDPPSESADGDVARAIEEADLYRVAGDTLYLLNAHRGLMIVDLARLELLGRLPMRGMPVEMYLRGTRAFVLLAGGAGEHGQDGRLLEVDTNDPTAPALLRSAELDGDFRTSRIVGDVLYTVSSQATQSFTIGSQPFDAVARVALTDSAQFAHATDTRLIVAAPFTGTGTRLTVIDIAKTDGSMTLGGAIDIPGYLDADTKLHYGAGALRAVTLDWQNQSLSQLFTIDIEDPARPFLRAQLPLVRGEQLFGTRFVEDRAYIVTFERIDPLWIVDLSDPDHPRVTAELLIPGFSTQLVADGDRLLTLGFDPAFGPGPVVSMFDVGDPARPLLQSRLGLGSHWSEALYERKAFTVLDDRVLVPVIEGLAVIDRSSTALSLRGTLPIRGGGLRGFERADELIGLGNEQVVVADRDTLVERGHVTIASNVTDVARLEDGRRIELVASGTLALVGEVELKLWPERMFVHRQKVAVVGWDEQGRAVRVIDFDTAPPTVSARLPIGWGGFATPSLPGGPETGAPGAMATDLAFVAPWPILTDQALTDDGWLVLHAMPNGIPAGSFGEGQLSDGLCLIDLNSGRAGRGIQVRGGAITGLAVDGTAIVFSHARHDGVDAERRPLLRHDAVRLIPAAGRTEQLGNVPGYVVAARGDRLTTVEEIWDTDWSYSAQLVAVRLGARVTVTDRLRIAEGAHGFRSAGATLCYQRWGVSTGLAVDSLMPWMTGPQLHVVHLQGGDLTAGPEIDTAESFVALLALEDGGLLLSRDGFTAEHWDVSGDEAALSFERELSGYPIAARPDPARPGSYLIALGYAGFAEVP